MEVIALDYFNNDIIVREVNSSSALYSYLSEDNKKYTLVTHDHVANIYQKLMDELIIKTKKSNFWEETDGCAKQYRCALYVYLMKNVSLKLKIIIYRAIGALVHGKYAVDGLNETD